MNRPLASIPPPANAEDGLAALKLVEAVYECAARIRA